MSLVVNHNLMAMNAARNLTTIYGRLSSSVQKLSSGLRINSAADDAAGLAIRELMRADIATLNQGIRNASDAISMIQTAEGAMSVIDEKLIRMKELAEQAATGTYTTAQREILNSEYQAMAAEIDRIANATNFNGVKLLDGSLQALHNGSGMKIHFGTGNAANEDYYFITMGDMRATEGTGLRVGNSDTRDIWTSTGLNLTDGDSTFASTGVFGIQYSTDGGTSWNTYGWVSIDATDTVSDVVEEVNSGPQWTSSMTFGATCTTGNLHGETLTINGNIFTFDSSITAGASTANSIGINGAANSVAIAQIVTEYINDRTTNGDSSTDAFATTTSTTQGVVVIYNENFGPPAGSTSLATSDATLAVASWTQTTGAHISAAAVVQDEYGYELQISSARTGSNNQVRLLAPDGTAFNYSTSGVTREAVAGGITLPTSAGYLTMPGGLNEATEWEQTENGEGTTAWAAADILTQSSAQLALGGIDEGIERKDIARANLGAFQNRLENTITNLQIQAENLQAAESRISDADVATEMTEFTRNNILAQAAVAMLAQANSLPSLALTLLGG